MEHDNGKSSEHVFAHHLPESAINFFFSLKKNRKCARAKISSLNSDSRFKFAPEFQKERMALKKQDENNDNFGLLQINPNERLTIVHDAMSKNGGNLSAISWANFFGVTESVIRLCLEKLVNDGRVCKTRKTRGRGKAMLFVAIDKKRKTNRCCSR
jgi:hypothetical protein